MFHPASQWPAGWGGVVVTSQFKKAYGGQPATCQALSQESLRVTGVIAFL